MVKNIWFLQQRSIWHRIRWTVYADNNQVVIISKIMKLQNVHIEPFNFACQSILYIFHTFKMMGIQKQIFVQNNYIHIRYWFFTFFWRGKATIEKYNYGYISKCIHVQPQTNSGDSDLPKEKNHKQYLFKYWILFLNIKILLWVY